MFITNVFADISKTLSMKQLNPLWIGLTVPSLSLYRLLSYDQLSFPHTIYSYTHCCPGLPKNVIWQIIPVQKDVPQYSNNETKSAYERLKRLKRVTKLKSQGTIASHHKHVLKLSLGFCPFFYLSQQQKSRLKVRAYQNRDSIFIHTYHL